jgi:hypothetical protein
MKHPIIRVSFFFGLACALVAFSFFLFLYWQKADALSIGRLAADAFSAFLFVIAAIWYFKKVVRRGSLHFWEGLSVGFLTNLFATIISATGIYLFITLIDPQVLTRHIAEMQGMLIRNKAKYVIIGNGEANFNTLLASVGQTTGKNIFWDEILKKLVVTVLVPIVAMLFRRQPYSLLNPGEPPVRPSVKKKGR